jgi:hypothetical protein
LDRLAVAAKLQRRLILKAIPHVLCLMKVYLFRMFFATTHTGQVVQHDNGVL